MFGTIIQLLKQCRLINESAFSCDHRSQNEDAGTSIVCRWLDCSALLSEQHELSEHVHTCHVEPMTCHEVFVCLWKGCKVFNKPSLSHSWLAKHVNTHTGDKPFKCMISGCHLSFSSQEGLARHVPSHFKEPTQPKKSKAEDSPKRVLKKKKTKVVKRRKPPVQGIEITDIREGTVCYLLGGGKEGGGGGGSLLKGGSSWWWW